MPLTITHPFVSGIAEKATSGNPSPPGRVGPTEWNANHTVTGSADLTINTTAVLSGSGNNLLYDNSGVLAEVTLGGTLTLSGGTLSDSVPVGHNPTATGGPAAVNGVATTFMRSDASPAIQTATTLQQGLVQPDGTTITISGGVITAAGGAASLVIGSSAITGGTNSGDLLYDSGPGTLQEATDVKYTGSGNLSLTSINTIDISLNGDSSGKSFVIGNAFGGSFPTGSYNIGIGYGAYNGGVVTAGALGNIAIGGISSFGAGPLNTITSGNDNVGIGRSCGLNLTTGVDNVCIGRLSGQGITSGTNNFCLGQGTGAAIGAGTMCVAIGAQALQAGPLSFTLAVGASALNNCTGSNNTAVGALSASSYVSGIRSTFIGYGCGANVTGGNNTTMIGTWAGPSSGPANFISLAVDASGPTLDYNFTNASKWTFVGNLIVPALSTAGVLVNDASGNIISNSTVAAATVAANFTADHRLQVTIAGTTYYIAMSTTAW